jgi:maltose alpha-D-glucosyltransferase/alpha-amylase
MNFHFPLMPRLFMALAKADRTPLVEILKRTPDLPAGCQWATFLRCHDELTLEMVTPEEREFMWNFYAPEPRMRLNLGIRRRLAPLLGNDLRRIKLAHSLLLTFSGSPVIYYGDEIGLGDNIWLDDRGGVHADALERSNQRRVLYSRRLYAPLADFKVNVEQQR